MLQKITINNYLSEHKQEILSVMTSADIHSTLLYSPTGSGKTTLLDELYEYSKGKGWTMIVVSPNVANIKQESKRLKFEGLYDKACYMGGTGVITTPDKLIQVIDELKAKRKPYLLVVDEAHERYCNTLRYEAFNNITLAESKAEKVIYMSATPEPMPKGISDIIIQVDRLENKFIDLDIKACQNVGNENYLNEVLKLKEQHKQVVAFINDKKAIQSMTETLKIQYPDLKVGYMTADTKEEELFETIVNECTLLNTYDIIFTTEVVKAGVNINHYEDDLALLIRGKDLQQCDVIQFIARFRKGVQRVQMLFTQQEEVPATEGRQTIYNKINNEAINILSVIDRLPEADEVLFKHLRETYGIIKDPLTRKYIIDDVLVRCSAEKEYNNQLKQNLNLYAKTLRETNAIKFNVTMSEGHEIARNELLRETVKATKEKTKEEQKNALEWLKKQSKWLQEAMFNNSLDLTVEHHLEVYNQLQIFKESAEYKLLGKVSQTMYYGDLYRAFKRLCEVGKEELETEFKQHIAKEINSVYSNNKENWKEFIKVNRKDNLITDLSKLRIMCDELNLKNGTRLSNKKLFQLVELGVEKKYIKNVSLEDLKEGQKNKKVIRATGKLLKNLQILCLLTKDNNDFRISSYR